MKKNLVTALSGQVDTYMKNNPGSMADNRVSSIKKMSAKSPSKMNNTIQLSSRDFDGSLNPDDTHGYRKQLAETFQIR